ncbi:MAG: hypothetical protein RKH07_12565 [Gammaproteobacteria bacterium]
MNLIGGNFGTKGRVKISTSGVISISGAKAARYARQDISAVRAETEQERNFGVLGFIIGAVVLTIIGLFIFGIVGAAIGFIVALMGSFHTTTTHKAQIEFNDGKEVSVAGSQREINKIIKFGP